MIKDIMFIIASCTWGVIMTLMGFVFLLIQLARHVAWKFLNKEISIIQQVIYYKGRIGVTLIDNIGGVALGMIYFVGRHNHNFTHIHERGHTVQNIIFGPLFLPIIGIPSIVRAALWPWISKRARLKGKPTPDYYKIWFEHQANVLGNRLENN